jgi:hypothetical protein
MSATIPPSTPVPATQVPASTPVGTVKKIDSDKKQEAKSVLPPSPIGIYLVSPCSVDYQDDAVNEARVAALLKETSHGIILIPATARQQKVSMQGREKLQSSIKEIAKALNQIKNTSSTKAKQPANLFTHLESVMSGQKLDIKDVTSTMHEKEDKDIEAPQTPANIKRTVEGLQRRHFETPGREKITKAGVSEKYIFTLEDEADEESEEAFTLNFLEKYNAADDEKCCFIFPLEKTHIVLKALLEKRGIDPVVLQKNIEANKGNSDFQSIMRKMATDRVISALKRQLPGPAQAQSKAESKAWSELNTSGKKLDWLHMACANYILGEHASDEIKKIKNALIALLENYTNRLIDMMQVVCSVYTESEAAALFMLRAIGTAYYARNPDCDAVFEKSAALCSATQAIYPVEDFPEAPPPKSVTPSPLAQPSSIITGAPSGLPSSPSSTATAAVSDLEVLQQQVRMNQLRH